MAIQSWKIGDVQVSKIVDLIDPFDAARAYPGADLSEFDKHLSWLTPYFYDPGQKAIIFSFHAYLIRTGKHNILIDTCVGDHKSRAMMPNWHLREGPFIKNLAAAGVRPEQIDFVMCTHLHGDHVGWNTKLENGQWVPTFPKARYIFHRKELEAIQAQLKNDAYNAPSYMDSVLPVIEKRQADLVDTDHEFLPGIHVCQTPGHSAGHYCVEVKSNNMRCVMSGDVIHNPIQVVRPDWETMFCADKQAAVKQRTAFVDKHTDQDITIFAAHFGGPTAGHIRSQKGGGRIFQVMA
jgi:glyoxylase-like metal-dependent hydrolase (beta-lactamase superfamily II)